VRRRTDDRRAGVINDSDHEPTPSTRNIITEGVHDKRVGQPGGFGCGEGSDAVCDVTFTVTAVELNPPCPAAPPSGKRLLRIEVDAQAPTAFQHEPPATARMLSHWAIKTPDGKMQYNLQRRIAGRSGQPSER
jgi:hypothetical protein